MTTKDDGVFWMAVEDIDAEKPQGGLGSRIWVRFGRISGFAGFGG